LLDEIDGKEADCFAQFQLIAFNGWIVRLLSLYLIERKALLLLFRILSQKQHQLIAVNILLIMLNNDMGSNAEFILAMCMGKDRATVQRGISSPGSRKQNRCSLCCVTDRKAMCVCVKRIYKR